MNSKKDDFELDKINNVEEESIIISEEFSKLFIDEL